MKLNILSTFSIHLYGYDRIILDDILGMFHNCPSIEKTVFFDGAPADAQEKIEYLVAQGFLKENPRCLNITLAGRLYYDNGGFRKDVLRQLVNTIVSVGGGICGIVTFLAQFIG